MSDEGIEEIVIAAARGESLPAEIQARVEAALRESADCRALYRSQLALSADLRTLRKVLQRAAAEDRETREDVLVNAFGSRAPRSSERRRRSRVPLLAAAAVAGVAAVAAAWITLAPPGAGARRAAAAGTHASAPALRRAAATAGRLQAARESSAAVFRPLMYAPRPSAWESYSVVRVRIPLSSLAPSAAGNMHGTVDADVLVGEDGLARAIRFDDAQGFPAAATADSGGTQ